MIKVLQYIGSLRMGGSQIMIMNLYRNIDRSVIQFDFIIHDDSIDTSLAQEAEQYGAVIYQCPRYSLSSFRAYSKWWRTFFYEHPEYKIVHSHVRSTAAIVLRLANNAGCVTISHSHSTSSGGGISGVVKSILQHRIRKVADYFMACSQTAGEWLFGHNICSSERFFILNNAINVSSYIYDSNVALQTRKELGLADDDFVIGHVGRFVDQKNHMFLLDIFREIHERNGSAKFLLVGDGEMRDAVEEKVSRYGLTDCVIMTGERFDVNKLMMAMDVFVFPSKCEGLGMVLIEAQATGLLCFASDVVPKEAQISDLISFLSLEKSACWWADRILAMTLPKRGDMSKVLREQGYDVVGTSRWIQKFYEEILVNRLTEKS